MWRTAMLYLGLGPDDEYDDYDQVDDRGRAGPAGDPLGACPTREPSPVTARPAAASRPAPRRARRASRRSPSSTSSRPCARCRRRRASTVPKPQSVVRPVPAVASAKPHVVAPTSFNQAQDVADKFKDSQPVILNLQGVDRDLSRRLIDFSSGLCYGLGGQMEKVAHQVYLLTPTNVEVSADERRRLSERGLHDA